MVRVINKNPLEVFDFQGNALRCVRYFNLLFFQNIIILQLSTNKQLVTIGSYRKISLKIFCYLDNWVYIWVLI